jgi:hypothetical protein
LTPLGNPQTITPHTLNNAGPNNNSTRNDGGPTPIVLVRGAQPDMLGQYLYHVAGPPNQVLHIGQPGPALMDTTKFKLTAVGQLWEKVANTWVKAKKRDNSFVTQTKTSYFSTSHRSAGSQGPPHINVNPGGPSHSH